MKFCCSQIVLSELNEIQGQIFDLRDNSCTCRSYLSELQGSSQNESEGLSLQRMARILETMKPVPISVFIDLSHRQSSSGNTYYMHERFLTVALSTHPHRLDRCRDSFRTPCSRVLKFWNCSSSTPLIINATLTTPNNFPFCTLHPNNWAPHAMIYIFIWSGMICLRLSSSCKPTLTLPQIICKAHCRVDIILGRKGQCGRSFHIRQNEEVRVSFRT